MQYTNDSTTCRSCKVKELKKCFSEVEHELQAIEQLSQSTNLVFNPKNTKSMLFSTRIIPPPTL